MKVIKFFAVLFIVVFALTKGCESFVSNSEPAPILNANVSFDGSQFTIQNKDTFDYVNTTLRVNEDYEVQGQTLKAGETYTVGVMQFANEKGERFTLNL